MKFKEFVRIRRPAPDPKKNLRLHRAEFGSDFKSKNYNLDNYYPDSTQLINKLARFHKVNINQIVVGLGGESLIKDIFLWHSKKKLKTNILNSSSNFFMYTFYSKLFSYKNFYYDVNPQFQDSPSLKDIKHSIKKNKINLLVLVNPSSPIEKLWTKIEVIKILNFCRKRNVTVIIDEVYQLLGSKTSIQLTKKFNNLIIVRSFSKAFGYPGIRMGYIVTSKSMKEEIESFRLAIELPQDTIDKSIYLIDNFDKIVKKRISQIVNARNFANREFKKRSIKSFGKYSNVVSFVFETEKQKVETTKYLKKKNIYINDGFKNHLSKYASVTTTNIKNLKIFFKNLDKAQD